ncbi:glycosyl transferase [Massospora cicadina]|nr:glycosyl transferase [Massospora cicadina]
MAGYATWVHRGVDHNLSSKRPLRPYSLPLAPIKFRTRSTDFEVHRNWLAITYSLPITRWYTEATSRWTLDYPPFFAWFEAVLSRVAYRVDPEMLRVKNLGYASPTTVAFQRTSVIVTELVLVYALYRVGALRPSRRWNVVAMLTFLHPALFIVDHIHFQYNGFMFGILLVSLVNALEGRLLSSGVLFAALLNLKHIYLYVAPPYFVFLLRGYCLGRGWNAFGRRLLILGVAVLGVFAVSLGPFVYFNQLPQLWARLFPFQRGLISTYWASNVWALYTVADLLLGGAGGGSTRGIEGEVVFRVLPQIKPLHTFGLTLASHLPALVALWRRPTPTRFIHAVALCGFGSYLFGWHVHEKAIMLVLFPLSLIAHRSTAHRQLFLFLSLVGTFSLFPLVFHPIEVLVVAVILVTWALVGYSLLAPREPLHFAVRGYYAGLIAIYLYPFILRPAALGLANVDLARYAFLPQMLTSLGCSLGMLGAWVHLYSLMYTLT